MDVESAFQYFDCECHYRIRSFHPCVLFHEYMGDSSMSSKGEEDFYPEHRAYDEVERKARQDADLRRRVIAEGIDKCAAPALTKRRLAKLPKLPLAEKSESALASIALQLPFC